MPKEDYLLKYLEKLSRVIAAMLGFRDKGFPEDALRLADETYRELLSIDLETLTQMPVERFIEAIKKTAYTATYLELLAKLTHETARNFSLKGDILSGRIYSEKALLLYRLLNDKDKTFSFEREMTISELERDISER